MKYIYFYSTANIDFEGNYAFGRYSYTDNMYAPIADAYSDNLFDWDKQSPIGSNITPPRSWFMDNYPATIKEFLALPTTYTARSPREFKSKYPELFI